MASPLTQLVTIQLDKPRPVLFDLGALSTAESLTGVNYFQGVNWANLAFRDLHALLYAGLKSGARKMGIKFLLSFDDVGALIDLDNISVLPAALAGAFAYAMPAGPREEATRDEDGDKKEVELSDAPPPNAE